MENQKKKLRLKPVKFKNRQKAGLPPGSIVFTGKKKVEEVHLHRLKYNEDHFEDHTYIGREQITFENSTTEMVDWYDMRGLHDIELIEAIGKQFDIHNLILEDIADPNQRPKFEEYPNSNFVVLKALHFDRENIEVKTEQVALIFGHGLLLSFQEDETDLFHAVRDRLRTKSGRIRQRGADYLCYALIDNIVDHYFFVIDEVEQYIDSIENRLLNNIGDSIRSDIHALKKEVVSMRKSIAPLREAISRFSKSESALISDETTVFIRDLHDHTIQVMDMVETYRDVLNGLQDLYISEISLKMNQVMQVLTIITTIFVPLSFLAGLYGMNFQYIPELNFKYGYFFLLGIMFLIFIGALYYFKRKKWL